MNEPSILKRHWPALVLCFTTAAALTGCLLLMVYLYLPKLATDRLPVAQIRRLGFADFMGRISRIGLFQTAAGPVVFGHVDQAALSIDSIVIDYTPGELRRKKIRRLRISDVTVNGALGPNGLAFPGLDRTTLARQAPIDQSGSDDVSPLAGIVVEQIEIRSGMVNLTWHNATYKIPFEADLKPAGTDATKLDVHLRLYPRDQPLTLVAQVDVDDQQARVSFDGPAIAMDRFADLIHLINGLDATGQVTVQTEAVLTWSPLRISNANVDLSWSSGRLAYASAIIEPERDGTPAILSAVSEDLRTWQIKVQGVALRAPAPLAMNRLAATVNLGLDARDVSGKAELTLLPWSIEGPRPVSMKNSASLPVTFDVSLKASGEWAGAFSTGGNDPITRSDPLDITIAGASILGGVPRFSLTVKGDGQGGSADWQFDLKKIRATADGAVINLPSADARGALYFKDEPDGTAWNGHARVRLASPVFDAQEMAGQLDALTLSARFQKQGRHASVVDARLQCANGRFHHQDSGLRLSGGRLDLPFRSDPKATDSQGTFSVAQVDHRKSKIGGIKGRITQTKDSYTFTATHDSSLFPGMTAVLAGNVHINDHGLGDADLSFQIPPYELPAESDLGRFVPAAKGVALSGTISAQGHGSLSSGGFRGDMDLGIKGGELRMTDPKITVAGIDADLRFPELPRIRSGPAQPIRFARAAMGGIVVDGGRFDVQVESKNTLFVEKGRLNWCGGKVETQALRITAGKQDYQVSLYCQRLNLSRILEQLGTVNARGGGTVNGRIPIAYSDGRIRFDDGFLFSTPGETGQIQLTGTEMLTRGIPSGTPQFAQVELAQEALKDYAYSWAKLGLISEGEDFLMRLQFDGKPVNPLPFVYKKEIGSFVRVEAGAQGSVFQGIGLDVNLRLPLDQLLQYKDMVNMLQ
ncbi:YdbH domain-containing protein [Desulfosarcina sp.]|uniref:intermembrane phospholipid transport protein YdbH family protein n=1 Tax=Desulfosarcina sp. TaxID=2027861 RepID=UPI003566DF6D